MRSWSLRAQITAAIAVLAAALAVVGVLATTAFLRQRVIDDALASQAMIADSLIAQALDSDRHQVGFDIGGMASPDVPLGAVIESGFDPGWLLADEVEAMARADQATFSALLALEMVDLLARQGSVAQILEPFGERVYVLAEDGTSVFELVANDPAWAGEITLVLQVPLTTQGADGPTLNPTLQHAVVIPVTALGDLVTPELVERAELAWTGDIDELAFGTHDSGEVAGLTMGLVADVGDSLRAVEQTGSVLAIGAGILVVLAGLATWLITGRSLAPVSAMTERVDAITAGTLHERVNPTGRGDEIDTLAHTMNDLLDRLDASRQRRAQFVSDASHELRTPITVLRAEADAARAELVSPGPSRSGSGASDRARLEALAQVVDAESGRLEAMVSDLLQLARLDEVGVTRAAMVEVDLDDIVFTEAARPWPIPVDSGGVGAAKVMGDPSALARIVGHLLANATRHAKHRVWVSLESRGSHIAMSVADDGPGVPLERRDDIFERFSRLDEARDRDRGGAGLGLAVTKALVQAHGGSITVTDTPARLAPSGACFEVLLAPNRVVSDTRLR